MHSANKLNINLINKLVKTRPVFYVLSILLFFLSSLHCYPQGKEANIWYFEWKAGLDFNQGSPPAVLTECQLHTSLDIGTASIADSNGNLLFYTNGRDIWNKNHALMQNGHTIGVVSTQGPFIVPQPDSDRFYYVFNFGFYPIGPQQIRYNLQYSLIDMQQANGFGAVVDSVKEVELFNNANWQLCAVHHANKHDVWVLGHQYTNRQYYAYLVTADSVHHTPVISTAGSNLNHAGYLKISPNGKKIATTIPFAASGIPSFFNLLDFDNETGIVSDANMVYDEGSSHGVEFSPDNSLLYINGYDNLRQYDLNAGSPQDILESEILLPIPYPNRYKGGVLQLGPDGKIYCAIGCNGGDCTHLIYGGECFLSVIHNPNERGYAANFEQEAIYLEGRFSWACLPNFIQSYLNDPSFSTQNNCVGDATTFEITETNGIDSVFWKFNDLPNYPYDTSSLFSPSYTFSHAGTFFVDLTVYSNLLEKTVTQEVVIHPLPEPDLGNDTLFCDTDFSITLNANCEGDNFAWSTGQFGVPEITVIDTGMYWVNVNKDGCNNKDTIYIGLYPKPEVDTSGLMINPASCGVANGSITGLQIIGAEPLEYFWLDITGDTIGLDLDIDSLSAGIYTLLVCDGNGCTNTIGSYIVTDDGLMQVDSVQYTNDHCSQQGATLSVFAQEIGTGTISYSIDGGQTYLQNDGLFTGLPAGNFYVMIKDENDCEGIYQNNPVIIQDISGPEVTSVTTIPEQDYNQNGQINLEAVASEGSVYYSIDNGVSFQQDNGVFTGLSADTFYCVVKDMFACDTAFEVIVKRVFTTPLEAIAGDGNACIGNAVVSPLQLNNFNEVKSFQVKLTYDFDLVRCDGYINLNPELEDGFSASIIPDFGDIYLNWEGENPLSLPEYSVMTELVFSALVEGTSPVNWEAGPGESIFLDRYGQQLNVQYHTGTLRIYTNPEILMIAGQEICEGDTIIIHPNIVGGSGEKTFTWTGPGGFQLHNSILYLTNIQTNQAGTYTLEVYDTLDCEDQASFQLIVNLNPEIAFSGYDTLYVEPGYELHAGEGHQSYLWNTGAQTEYIVIDSTGEYYVQVISYKACIATETVQIRWSGTSFYLPNAFTPNGDGLNDVFAPVVRYDYIKNYYMSIFNRWGELIFESNNIYQGWDGTCKGKPAMAGVYVYRINYTTSGQQPQKSETVTGMVILIK